MATFFISDLHLCAIRPKTSEIFLKFLATDAKKAEALYILGDFFEAWVGDDNQNPHDNKIIEALASFTQNGIPVYFMHGNRDFLLSKEFAKKSGCTLLPDPTVIHLYQDKILLTHGDQMCTLDTKYQRFRKFVQHPITRKIFLSLPIFIRRKIATLLRAKSSARQLLPQNRQNLQCWDVVPETVNQILAKYQCFTLIHGHTHKAGIHAFTLDNQPAKRIVLGDWDDTGNVLIFNNDSISFKLLT